MGITRRHWAAVGLLGSALVAVRLFVAEPRTLSSGSMAPTLEVGDRVLVDKLSALFRDPAPGDIVAFRAPPHLERQGHGVMIKRVVGVAGQRVEVTDGHVLVDGVVLDEPYLAEAPSYRWGPEIVPPGALFLLGDSRNGSSDSHVWGFVAVDRVVGRVAGRIWPTARAGRLR